MRTEAQRRADERYESSGRRPARIAVNCRLTAEQIAALDSQRRDRESRAAALARLACLSK